ncbi:MATH and LRR domain-containing protein PFE0570w isoform X2 [Polistes fuscatus]|uniref:MATH and LRR domain-containing protein PFE0570w isoform X2 n=1 Tax=Polistes fuscatus TaxID=30207 RepID=UPI001CA9FE06|nr:MATH and LRR domain-containing protein PFE0570w isoform X2 [Polistes fuscatus]
MTKRPFSCIMENNCIDQEDFNLFSSLEIPTEQDDVTEDFFSNIISNNSEIPSQLISNDMWNLFEDSPLNDLYVTDNIMPNNELNSNEISNKEDYIKTINDWDEHLESLTDMDYDMNNIAKHTTLLNTSSSTNLNCPEETNVELISNMKIKIKGAGIADYKTNCLKNSNSTNSQEDFNTEKKIRKRNKTTKTITTKQRKIKRIAEIMHEEKQKEETEPCIDIVTVPEETPMLEAGDVNSLFEQFEASEILSVNTLSHNKISAQSNQIIKAQPFAVRPSTEPISPVLSRHPNLSVFKRRKNSPIQPKNTNSPVPSGNVNSPVHQKKQNLLSSNLIKDINDPASKEVIDRIKALNKETKKGISVIPAMPNIRKGRSNGSRTQGANGALSKNKSVKVTNKIKNKTVDGGSVQLDHDYCSNSNSTINDSDNSVNEKKASDNSDKTLSANNKSKKLNRSSTVKNRTSVTQAKSFTDSEKVNVHKNSIKDNSLESAKNINNSDKPSSCNSNSINTVGNQVSKQTQELPKNPPPITEMKIQSAIVAKILRSKNKGLNNTKSIQDNKQMISVLKKPPTVQPTIQPITTNNNESIVTTTNSSNNIIQNIIIENTPEIPKKVETKQPPRRKLNLAEYRNRRGNTTITTKLPVEPLTIVNIYTASTSTEPFADQLGNELWCERECLPKKTPETDLNRPKPPTRDMQTQTYETVFNYAKKCFIDFDKENDFHIESLVGVDNKNKTPTTSPIVIDVETDVPTKSLVDVNKKNEERPSRKRTLAIEEQLAKKTRKVDSGSSSSRSRSHSRSRSNSHSCSPNHNKHQRDRSKNRSTRHICNKRNNHRPSSISSNVSCTSQSLSDIRSNSRSRQSFSRSESSRSRSTSMSDHYSPCSRSSSDNYQRSHSRYSEEKSNEYRENVIYAGWLESGVTRTSLYQRFRRFGPITRITIHVREHPPWDHYGFITFEYKHHAFEALEHANDDPNLPRYDLNFGHRRDFCEIPYEDLDHYHDDDENKEEKKLNMSKYKEEEETFDSLLKEAQAIIGKRKA